MSKPTKSQNTPSTQSDAFEMIELACDDLNALTRAFDLIEELCQFQHEENSEELAAQEINDKIVWN